MGIEDSPVSADGHRQGAWCFGRARLDRATASLEVDGRPVDLDRSSHDLLLALLRRAGEVVTKDELLEAGWPGRVVSENSLAKAIGRLRQALGPDGDALRAVHGYGYRLALPVRWDAGSARSPAIAASGAAPVRPGQPLPHRTGWRLEAALGRGGAGPRLLARADSGEARAVEFADGERGLHALRREHALLRRVEALRPGLPHVARVLDCNFVQPPFFLALAPLAPDLPQWADDQGGLAAVPAALRLELALALCEAVAALHEIGLVHGSLRPEAIHPVAVPGGWQVVLSDLTAGVADGGDRIVPPWPDLAAPAPDPADARAPYVAPEVLAGDPATRRADVHALGVLLYQLAVGDLHRPPAPGWEATVDDALLREDIAAAAALDPRQRPADAAVLAERLRTRDARRAQAADAAAAQARATARERELARERTRRRLWGATAAALGVGLVGVLAMYAIADRARRDAELQARQRQAVVDFVTSDVLVQADPYSMAGPAPPTVRAAIDRAAGRVDRRFAGDPAAAAAVHEMLGRVYFADDAHARAITHLERAWARLDAAAGGADLPRVRVATALCDVHRIAHRLREAEAACARATEAARSREAQALAALKRGQLHNEGGRHAQARRLLEPLLHEGSITGDRVLRGELLWTLGLAARGLGEFAEARGHFEQLLAHARAQGGGGTWTAWAYNSLGSVLVETGEHARAEPLLVEANRLFLASQGEGVESQMPQVWRTDLRLREGRWAEAAALQASMLEVWRTRLAEEHPLRMRGRANLAWALAHDGRAAEARQMLDEALAARERLFADDGSRRASQNLRWLRAALALGDLPAATTLRSLADDAIARELPELHPLRAEADCVAAELDRALGQADRARMRAERCERGLARFYPERHALRREARALAARLATR